MSAGGVGRTAQDTTQGRGSQIHFLLLLPPQQEELRQDGGAGAGAGCLPLPAPLRHSRLPVPVLPVCCEDPGWAQTHQPLGRFQDAWVLHLRAEGTVCVWSLSGCVSVLYTYPACAGHVLPCHQPGHLNSIPYLGPHHPWLTQVWDPH